MHGYTKQVANIIMFHSYIEYIAKKTINHCVYSIKHILSATLNQASNESSHKSVNSLNWPRKVDPTLCQNNRVPWDQLRIPAYADVLGHF